MNHALLTELQQLTSYPSITLLASTTPGPTMDGADSRRLDDLVRQADRRLSSVVDDELRTSLVGTIRDLVASAEAGRASRGIAVCVSPDHHAVIRLGRAIDERVAIGGTFATRDLVADVNRTATYRVVCVSDRRVRVLAGDRSRLVEITDSSWPLDRDRDESQQVWRSRLAQALRQECSSFAVPTILAGVTTTIRALVDETVVEPIGTLAGNHDHTPSGELFETAWPLVSAWLEGDAERALARLELARGARIFAGGLDEVWDLANDGRVELLVVEDDYRKAARIGGQHLEVIDDPAGDGVGDGVEDVVDELIETVMRSGGETVIVPPGELRDHDHLAAVLRY